MNSIYLQITDIGTLSAAYLNETKNTYLLNTDLHPLNIMCNLLDYRLKEGYSINNSIIDSELEIIPPSITAYPSEININSSDVGTIVAIVDHSNILDTTYKIEDDSIVSIAKDGNTYTITGKNLVKLH